MTFLSVVIGAMSGLCIYGAATGGLGKMDAGMTAVFAGAGVVLTVLLVIATAKGESAFDEPR